MPRDPSPTEAGMQPLVPYAEWRTQRFGSNTPPWAWNEYQQYKTRWEQQFSSASAMELQQNPDQYALPAEAAAGFAETNWQDALRLLEEGRSRYAQLGQPGDPYTQALINREMEYGASAASRDVSAARGAAAGSGLGRGGGLDRQEQLIREEMDRRNVAAMRDIRAGVQQESRAGQTGIEGSVANLLLQREWQLPASGVGAPAAAPPATGQLFGPQAGQAAPAKAPAPLTNRQRVGGLIGVGGAGATGGTTPRDRLRGQLGF